MPVRGLCRCGSGAGWCMEPWGKQQINLRSVPSGYSLLAVGEACSGWLCLPCLPAPCLRVKRAETSIASPPPRPSNLIWHPTGGKAKGRLQCDFRIPISNRFASTIPNHAVSFGGEQMVIAVLVNELQCCPFTGIQSGARLHRGCLNHAARRDPTDAPGFPASGGVSGL